MLSEKEYKTTILCPECDKVMYPLEGSLRPIYVCSNCGASLDENTMKRKQNENNNTNNEEKQSLVENIFSQRFMRKYTDFESFSEFIKHCSMFNGSKKKISSETIATLPKRKMNRFVRKHTSFLTWENMFQKAVECYLKM